MTRLVTRLLLGLVGVTAAWVALSATTRPDAPTKLDEVRAVISRARLGTRTPNDRLADGPLDGFLFAYDLDVGERIIVVSFNRRGLLLRFDASGSLTSSRHTDEIRAIQFVNLSGGARPFLMTEEVDTWGNGMFGKTYRLYDMGAAFALLWTGESVNYAEGLEGRPQDRRDSVGFVRIDQGGFGRSPRLTTITEDRLKSAFNTRTFELQGATIVERPK